MQLELSGSSMHRVRRLTAAMTPAISYAAFKGPQEHQCRTKRSHGACGFIGFWHTHPDMPAHQSETDMKGMAALVASIGHNQRRAMMLIYGRSGGYTTAGIYVYESTSISQPTELVSVGIAQIQLDVAVI